MVTKANKRKVAEFWHNQCAYCHKTDYLQFHHIKPKSAGGTDEPDNLLLLCACCHAAVHGKIYNPQKPNCRTSVAYETALPVLEDYFTNRIGARETKEKLKLSPKTHLSESALIRRYKREHKIDKFYNNVDLKNSHKTPNAGLSLTAPE